MILNKPYSNKDYADLAVYCKKNGLTIEDKGEYLESVNLPAPSAEEKQEAVRLVRNGYLADTDKFMLADYPLPAGMKEEYIEYRQYLRDFTKAEMWWEYPVATFEEFSVIVGDD